MIDLQIVVVIFWGLFEFVEENYHCAAQVLNDRERTVLFEEDLVGVGQELLHALGKVGLGLLELFEQGAATNRGDGSQGRVGEATAEKEEHVGG